MSKQTYCAIMCDSCGSEDNFFPTITEARRYVKAEGWARHGNVDHCPKCEAEHSIATAREIRNRGIDPA